jgi:sulfite exporter TauE/SafE
MNTALLVTALVMGLAGSLHCAGMCGPIVWIMPFQQYKGVKRGLGISLYHFGRISVYAILGLVLHLFKGLFHPQWQQYVSVTAGVLLLATGVLYFLPQTGVRIKLPWTEAVTRGLSKVLAQSHPAWLAAAGALNGFLPCGMVYMALAAAVSAAQTWQAVAIMYSFGLGTAPMMVAITLLRTKSPLGAISFRKWTPFVMLFFGCLFVVRGANLGIPYLSPKTATTESQEAKMECCHRPIK